jgi:GT2 family glycosyltransferase
LESIRCQTGYFGIEVVWIDDGSTQENSQALLQELARFQKTSRFTRYIYLKNRVNLGTAKSSNRGLKVCSSEIVFKMDSDDIMFPDRMSKQITFMTEHPDAVLCGANIRLFTVVDGCRRFIHDTQHPAIITWDQLYQEKPSWYMNNPTLCYRKKAIMNIGAYNTEDDRILYVHEDYDLLARVLKNYWEIYTLPDILLLYRMHPNQLTFGFDTQSQENVELRRNIIERASLA